MVIILLHFLKQLGGFKYKRRVISIINLIILDEIIYELKVFVNNIKYTY